MCNFIVLFCEWFRLKFVENLTRQHGAFCIHYKLFVALQGAVIGIDDEDDSTFTITVDQNRSYYFQGDCDSVWFTLLTETEISINGKILILLMEMKTEMNKLRKTETETEKFDTETDKFRYVRFRFRCISISRHHAGIT